MNEVLVIKGKKYFSSKVLSRILCTITIITFIFGDIFPDSAQFYLYILILSGILLCFFNASYDLTITNKRICGKVFLGKRIDLPIDSISSVGTSILGGVNFGTSSGKINFKFMKNKTEIYSLISKLLIERQQVKNQNNIQLSNSTSNADELKKFKNLFDSGIITQEEFDAKKKQLLEL